MKSTLAFRRALMAAGLVLTSLVATPSALATHLRGGTISWKVVSTTTTTYTVQFTLTESQRWSYPNTAGSCTAPVSTSTTACAPVGQTVSLISYSNGGFYFGDGSAEANPTGTITSINQAEDYSTATYVFTHAYTLSGGAKTAYFYAVNRISTLKLGENEPEYISTTVQDYPNASPVASLPAILSVPLQNTVSFDVSAAVTDIDPNANLVFRLSTFAEVYGPGSLSGLTSVPCPSGSASYAQGDPPGFSISPAGIVTWDTTQIVTAVSGGNCHLTAPKAGDLWTAQVMVQAYNTTTNALITNVPVDILMEFVSPVGALPTITLNPAGTQTLNIGSPVTFTATGTSTNAGTKVTLNASGVPAGATATGLNATVTPPAQSTFSWTPSASQAGSYVVTYTVTDSNLQQAQASETLIVATLPTITCSTGISPQYGSTGSLTATVYDPSNEVLNVVWTVDNNVVQTDNGLTAYPTAYVDTLTQNFGAVGAHTVVATTTDPHGVAVSCTTSATVVPADQTINFGSLPNVVYGTSDFALNATATSGLGVSYGAIGSCSIAGSSTLHITGAGGCQVTASQAGNTDYNPAPNVVQSFNITPAPLTATAGSYSGTYDGNAHALSACVVSSNPDGLTCTNNPAGPVGPDVTSGTVTPVLSGSASNYTVTSNNGSYAITPLTVTVGAGGYSGTYDGNTHAPSACMSSYAGVTCVNNPASVGPNAGTGSIVPVATVVTGTAADYQISPQSGAYGIVAAPSSVTVVCPATVTYTGAALTPCTATATGAGGLSVSVPVTYSSNKNVGNVTVSASYGGDPNHTASTASNASFNITPAVLTVNAGSYSGTYDGNTHALSACVVSSNPDNLTCTNNPSGSVGADVSSGTVTPVLSGSTSNYAVTSNNGSYTISPLTVQVTGGSYTGTYDGNSHAVSACLSSYAGVTCSNNPATVGPGVGSGPVAPTASVVSGVAADYSYIATAGRYSIASATSSVTLNCPASAAYTGAALTPCSATATGAGGLSSPVPVTYTTNVAVGVGHASATYAGDANHSGSSNTATFNITPAPLTVTAGSYSGTYDGHTHALSACVVSANPDNLTCTNNPAGPVGPGATTAVAVTPVLSGPATNYSVTTVNGSYAIAPLAASVTPNAATKVYGTADPALTGTLSGFLAADGVTATYSRIAGETVAGSPYTISAKLSPTAVLSNYSITYNIAGFTITKATPTLMWATPAAITYGTALSSTQLNATANTNGTFAYTPASGVLAAGAQTLSVLFTPSDAADYTTATKSVSLTVNKASTTTSIAVTTTQTVTGTTAKITSTVTPQISGTPTGTVTYYDGTTVLGSAAVGTTFTTGVLSAGSHSISATYSGDTNFNTSSSAKTTVTGVAPTTVQLIIPVPVVLYPLPVAYTVIVPLKGLQLISGTITIYDGTTAIATLPLLPGGIDVGVTLPSLSIGTHKLTAVYNGDSHYPPGVSPVVTVTVIGL